MLRRLKIIEHGDFWKKKTVPVITLKGKWLREAGFEPSGHVVIEKVGDSLVLTPEKALGDPQPVRS